MPPKRNYIDDEHYRSPEEQALRDKINALLKAEVPEGAKAEMECIGGFVSVKFVCSGAVPITCYFCCLKPNHEGQCYSVNKSIHFTPETR